MVSNSFALTLIIAITLGTQLYIPNSINSALKQNTGLTKNKDTLVYYPNGLPKWGIFNPAAGFLVEISWYETGIIHSRDVYTIKSTQNQYIENSKIYSDTWYRNGMKMNEEFFLTDSLSRVFLSDRIQIDTTFASMVYSGTRLDTIKGRTVDGRDTLLRIIEAFHNPVRSWFQDGRIKEHCLYYTATGVMKENFNEYGTRISLGTYHNSQMNGRWQFYDSTGAVIDTVNLLNGKEVSN